MHDWRFFNWHTAHERVAGEAKRAAADRVVVHNLAARILTAGSGTRIAAPLTDAGFVERTFGADNAFRSAVGWRADKTCLARAHGMSVRLAADAVRPTRGRRARVDRFVLLWLLFGATLRERVTGVTGPTSAAWRMVDNVTFGVNAAHTRARVGTLAVHTSPNARTVAVGDTFRSAATVRIAKVIRQTGA